jgi:predicted O-methyltransferase YrrM
MAEAEALRLFIRDLLAKGEVRACTDGRRRRLDPVAIGAGEGRALHDWIRSEGASRTVETGLGFGIAALFICNALLENGPGGRHVAIDPYQMVTRAQHSTSFAGVGLQVLEEAGVDDLVEFYAEESQIVLPRLLAEGRRFDLAFLDGNHRFEGIFLDLIYVGRLIGHGGIVFVDDTQYPSVSRAVGFCIANLGWAIEEEGREGDAHAWTVLRTGPDAAYQRPFTEHVDW